MPRGQSFSAGEEQSLGGLVGEAEGRSHGPQRACLLSATQELDALQQVWEITRDWEENWNQWKTGRFLTLQTETMESMAHGLFRRLARLAKEYKVRGETAGAAGAAWEGGRSSDAACFCSGPELGNY